MMPSTRLNLSLPLLVKVQCLILVCWLYIYFIISELRYGARHVDGGSVQRWARQWVILLFGYVFINTVLLFSDEAEVLEGPWVRLCSLQTLSLWSITCLEYLFFASESDIVLSDYLWCINFLIDNAFFFKRMVQSGSNGNWYRCHWLIYSIIFIDFFNQRGTDWFKWVIRIILRFHRYTKLNILKNKRILLIVKHIRRQWLCFLLLIG